MKTGKQIYLIVMLFLVVCATAAWSYEATAARFIRAKVSLDGNTVLEGSWSDDGHVDADGVWEYLKSIKFKTTQHFTDLKIDPSAKEMTLASATKPGQPGSVVVNIAYGGKAFKRQLKLVRVPVDEYGRERTLDAIEVNKMFDDRLIRRSDAAKLANPRQTKR